MQPVHVYGERAGLGKQNRGELMGSGDVSTPCGGECCPLRPPAVLLCLQICALLFASLYILCHFVIRHFKKQTDFAAGRRIH